MNVHWSVRLSRSAARAAATILAAYTLCFLLLECLPGRPGDSLRSPSVPQEQALRTQRVLGLQQPAPERWLRGLAALARRDLGISSTMKEPVAVAVAAALPHSFALGLAALVLAYAGGVSLALAVRLLQGAAVRTAARLWLAGSIVPRFFLAVSLIFVFHSALGWLPASHAWEPAGFDLRDYLRHLVLPVLSLGLPAACVVALYQSSALEDALRRPHARAARASGTGGLRYYWHHGIRPSAAPVLGMLGLDLPVLVSGAMVVETIFAWPGMGRLTTLAILGRDYPLALATSVLSVTAVLAGRWLGAVLGAAADPARREVPWSV